MNQHLAAAGEVGRVVFDADIVGLLLLAYRHFGGNAQAMPAKIGERIANAKLVYRSPLGLVGDPERMLARDVEVFLRPVLANGELVERVDGLDGADVDLRDAPQGDGAGLRVRNRRPSSFRWTRGRLRCSLSKLHSACAYPRQDEVESLVDSFDTLINSASASANNLSRCLGTCAST